MKLEYNEYGEATNRVTHDGKSCIGMTYNKGNKHGTSNKGKKYNKRIDADRDNRPHITKVAMHYNATNTATCCIVWNNIGDVVECDPFNLPRTVIGFMRKHTHNRRTDTYYRDGKIVMSDVTFDKYIKSAYEVDHLMK